MVHSKGQLKLLLKVLMHFNGILAIECPKLETIQLGSNALEGNKQHLFCSLAIRSRNEMICYS